MTPIPPDRLPPYRDDAIVWPIPDETHERMVDRWLSNYCYVLNEPCQLFVPYWAGWGAQGYQPRRTP